ELGPGLLGQVIDGLANPLAAIAQEHGFFLPRGVDIAPIDEGKKWTFTPTVSIGDKVVAGQAIGTVPEGPFAHKIMVPFNQPD
ncbi:MAG: V-type ATP synthase subunit A, partial [Anaerolineae bacterium]|nr:V-type ATP synthase subunit A [Anaerolineae bacterium]